MIFDIDTLRTAAAWRGTATEEDNFIDWRGIQFNGAHGIHPRVVGKIAFANASGPGWANPQTAGFADDRRVVGRDGKRYGPLPRDWAKYRGMYHHGQDVVFSYTVGDTDVLESPGLGLASDGSGRALVLRTLNLGPRKQTLWLQAAQQSGDESQILNKPLPSTAAADRSVVTFGPLTDNQDNVDSGKVNFAGDTYLEVGDTEKFNFTDKDFSIVARIRTKSDGTIIATTEPGPKWVPDGQAFFVRGGRLVFDVGWVGAVEGKTEVADGDWHDVRVSWRHRDQRLRLYVDGELDGQGNLAAKEPLEKRVIRIGYAAPNFPREPNFFVGQIESLRFIQASILDNSEALDSSIAWELGDVLGPRVMDATGQGIVAVVCQGADESGPDASPLVAGFAPRHQVLSWESEGNRLLLRIEAGEEPVRFTIWQPTGEAGSDVIRLADYGVSVTDRDLRPLLSGGPARWNQVLTTDIQRGSEEGPFAADVLEAPKANPWLAQTRFTGLDFYPGGRMAVCTWDGDVWLVSVDEDQQAASWRRIASGMFQPLGLKIINDKIHVMCRDQLTVLHDLNGDEEIDFYECLNNDHQVTEHFHEFAMGLQTDEEGNFYYAKSGQHGLAAVVPHHGTLLKVAKDGSETTILANGFRAANGVCLNPDGSFFVTDQEGFWNPKNRINWVTVAPNGEPKFYGNMLGYHNIEDDSDDAMEPPLCWITNAFDRSPGELLWVDSEKWGPLNGSLLNLSYGYGKVFLVPHQRVGDQIQGGMIQLPIGSFPTGVMRGRFHPLDQHLYLCGMFAWAGNATEPGGLYRLRPTGKSMHLPVGLRATKQGLKLTFNESLEPDSVQPEHVKVKVWSLKRTANYGSKHYDEHELRESMR